MAIIPMQKVAVVAHRSLREPVLDSLQQMGVLEITEAKAPVTIDHTETDFKSAELAFAIYTLKDLASRETQTAAIRASSPEDIVAAASHTDVRGIVDTLHRLEEEDTAAERRIGELHMQLELLEPWTALPYRLDAPAETVSSVRLLGTISESRRQEWEQIAQSLTRLDLQVLGTARGVTHYAATVWKKDLASFEELATAHGWTSVSLPVLNGTPAQLHEAALLEEKQLHSIKRRNHELRVQLSAELPNLLRVRTFMSWLSDKQAAREAMAETFATVTLLGWTPRAGLEQLEQRLQKIATAIAVLRVKPDENEEAPVLLKNSRFVTPFESVTTLYGFPLPGEMDPTTPLTPFFMLYFALCLTDGGYGLVLALAFGAYLLKARPGVEEAKIPWTLFISGIASVIVGIPFGGWFGLSPAQVPAFLTVTAPDGTMWFRGQLWNLGTESGIAFLQNLALILGLTHIFFGVFLAGWHKWVHGQRASAFWEHFTTHMLAGGVLFYVFAPAEMKQVAAWALYATVALFVWGKGYGSAWYIRPIFGVLGALNFAIGLLSNTLSYLRLLALGLVTGAIALAVNQVAIEMSRLFPAFLAIPVMILIAAGGHLVSIALNTLGSFIHSGRLQFIEFFSQFFEGGGRPFAPLRRSITS